jgi:hypothetical protein
MAAMRGRLMAYSKGMPGGRTLRAELQQVSSVAQVEDIAERHMGSVSAEEVSVSGEISNRLTVTGTNAAWCAEVASEAALAP